MEQQARILRSLLAQLDRQKGAEDEEAPDGIAAEFARLKSQSTKYRADKTFPTKAADKQENIKKNRYKDIVPFDHTRVKLTFTTTKNDTDYINASFIKGVSESRAYIATQGPLPHTVVDFLRMLWEHNVRVVVMACREFEMGKKKCELYWPQKQERAFSCEPFTVYCDSEETKGDYMARTLRVTYRNCSRTLKQLHYVNWPDHGVPDSIPPILDMLHEMRSYQTHDEVPICVHCSAGCGRTGALCVIDYTWNLLKKRILTADFSIYNLVQDMRTQRPSVVQTKEQYELVYRTIRLLFQRYLESVDAQRDQKEVTIPPPAVTEGDGGEDFDMNPHFQHLLDKERNSLPQFLAPSTLAADHLLQVRANDLQSDLQSGLQSDDLQSDLQSGDLLRQRLPRACPTATQDTQQEHSAPPNQGQTSLRPPEVEERTQEREIGPVPPLDVATSICLMVEDPYFDPPVSSPSSKESPGNPADEQWECSTVFRPPALLLNDQVLQPGSPPSGTGPGVEVAPPLPERTPESYILAGNTEPAGSCESLSVIIPPNAAAEAVRELRGGPPSPVPPLPERTPESFELPTDFVPVEEKLKFPAAVNLNRVGSSSERFAGSSPAAAAGVVDGGKPFTRSKSLKVKMTFSAPVTHFDLTSNKTSHLPPAHLPPGHLLPSHLPPAGHLDHPDPPQLHQPEESVTPPLPDRTPDSFVVKTGEKTSQPTSIRPGMSFEWDGTSQPRLLDMVMSRSKSVRTRGSTPESLTVAQQLAPLPVARTAGGSDAQTERSRNTAEKSSEKEAFRRKSLKFFRQKLKPKTAPAPLPAPPGELPQPPPTSSSPFKLGFGNRFGKPKGPRKHPETWL